MPFIKQGVSTSLGQVKVGPNGEKVDVVVVKEGQSEKIIPIKPAQEK